MEYEMMNSKMLACEVHSVYTNGKEFAYDHIQQEEVVAFQNVCLLLFLIPNKDDY